MNHVNFRKQPWICVIVFTAAMMIVAAECTPFPLSIPILRAAGSSIAEAGGIRWETSPGSSFSARICIIWPPGCYEDSVSCYRRLREEFGIAVVQIPYDHDNPGRYTRALRNAHAGGWRNSRIRVNVNCCDIARIADIVATAHAEGDTSAFHSIFLDEPFFRHGSCAVCPPDEARMLRDEVRRITHGASRFVIGGYLRWELQCVGLSFDYPLGVRFSDRIIFDGYAQAADAFTYTKYQRLGFPMHDQRPDWSRYVCIYRRHRPELCINLSTEGDEFEDLLTHADYLGVRTIELYALEDDCTTFFERLRRFVRLAGKFDYCNPIR